MTKHHTIVTILLAVVACSKSNSDSTAPAPKLVAAAAAPTPTAAPAATPTAKASAPAGLAPELALTLLADATDFEIGELIKGSEVEPGHDAAWLRQELDVEADDPATPTKLADGMELRYLGGYATYRTFGAKAFLCRSKFINEDVVAVPALKRARTTCLGARLEGGSLVIPFTFKKSDALSIIVGNDGSNPTLRYSTPSDPATVEAAAAKVEMVKTEKLATGYWVVSRYTDGKGKPFFQSYTRLTVGSIDVSCEGNGDATVELAIADAQACTRLRAP